MLFPSSTSTFTRLDVKGRLDSVSRYGGCPSFETSNENPMARLARCDARRVGQIRRSLRPPNRLTRCHRNPASILPCPPTLGLVVQLRHLRVYAEDALVLDEGSRTGAPQAAPRGGAGEGREAYVIAVAPDASCKEVGQLEMDRKAVLQGCRDGFAACYDTFVGPVSLAPVSAGGDSLAEAAGAAEEGGRSVDGAGIVGSPLPR